MRLKHLLSSFFAAVILVGCGKADVADDVSRIRDIKEQEKAEKASEKQSSDDYAKGVRDGAAAPMREIK